MNTTHAWFSIDVALRSGSSVYRKPDGGRVNVTRLSSAKDEKGHFPHDEKYLGEVVSTEHGGQMQGVTRVGGITDYPGHRGIKESSAAH